jgi:hypothetical protein
VKFVELEPLNTRKNGGYAATREANSGIRKKPAAPVARETSSAMKARAAAAQLPTWQDSARLFAGAIETVG